MPVIRALPWSLGTAVVAALTSWLVAHLVRAFGVPADAVVVLSTVAAALMCLGGCRIATQRLPLQVRAELAAIMVGPAILALLAFASAQPWWYQAASAGGIVLAAAAGTVLGQRASGHPLDAARPAWR